MIVFETKRLRVRCVDRLDAKPLFEIFGEPKVMHPIPLRAMTLEESNSHFEVLLARDTQHSEKKVWTVDEKVGERCIAMAALIKNDEGNDEIAYRLRVPFWGQGYGTEIAEGLIDYAFTELSSHLVTADVNVTNTGSVRILEKFLVLHREFYNSKDDCTDRRYNVTREAWLSRT